MNKSATLITTALLTLGFAAGSMAADMPKSAAPMAADTGTAAPAASKAKSGKSGKTGKSGKSGKSAKSSKSAKSHGKSTTPPATTK